LAEETEGACFGAAFSSVHSQNDLRILFKISGAEKVVFTDTLLTVTPLCAANRYLYLLYVMLTLN
jgi:hypothetical protein